MLRTRLYLNLIPFAVVLIAVAIYSVILFKQLGGNVSTTFTDIYQNDTTVQNMKQAVERMDAALQTSRYQDKAAARLMFDTNAREFEEGLRSQFTNTVILARPNVLFQLRTNYQLFQAVGQEMLAPATLPAVASKLYDNQVVPCKNAISVLLDRIRDAVPENILATGKTIQDVTHRITQLLILGLVIALILTLYASYKLSQGILRPIQTLTRAAREIGEGRLDLIVPVQSRDELGELANTFNKMAAQLNTYRQSTTEQIVRLHHTMEAALDSFSDPVFILDPEGRIELKNRAAEELSAQLALEGALPPKLAAAATAVIELKRDFLPHSFGEVLTLRTSTGEKSFLPRIHLMRDSAALAIGAAVVLHDVTRFRLLDDAKTNLVATVSHELKTPLTSVRMVLHMLLEESLGPLTQPQIELLKTAHRDSERLLRILDALLDIARLEAGASDLAKEAVTPEKLLAAIVPDAERTARAQGLTLTSKVQPGLPSIRVDQEQIKHVFHNYILNAIKHSPADAEIQVNATRTADGHVQFSVLDHGPGIAEQHQGLIFDRFYRVPNQAKNGVGLGLSIAREIVVAHGGRVGVRSQPGQGSEFFFVLEGE